MKELLSGIFLEVGTNNIILKAQLNKAQRSFQSVKAQCKMRNFILLTFEAQRNFRNCGTAFSYQVKAQPNFRNENFTTQCKFRIFCDFRQKKSK